MHVEVVTPQGTAVTTEADEVTAPGVAGEFGILPGHTAFVSALKPGVVSWKTKGQGTKKGAVAVAAGICEVSGPTSGKDRVLILAQQVMPAEQVDAAQAQRDLDDADQKLRDKPEGAQRAELEARRAWAQARLDAKKA